jgi:hypothetical protein
MNILFELVNNLDGYTLGKIQQKLETEKSKAFKLFLLYKSYKGKAEAPDDEKIKKLVYGSKAKGMTILYRLKNRLVNNIYQSLIELNISEKNSTFSSEQNLILYKIFLSKKMHELAEYCLQKAMKHAEKNEQYLLLENIYGEMISFCTDTLNQDPNLYIKKRRENFKMFNTLRTIDEILAVMVYRLKITQNLAGKLNVSMEIDRTLKSFASDKEVFKSTQFKIKFYTTVSHILVQQQKFEELEHFILKNRDEFLQAGIFNKGTHEIKIQQLVYLINSFLFQRKYDQAIVYGTTLHEALMEYNLLLYDKYIYFYYQTQIHSYAAMDVDKAMELQQAVLEKKGVIKEPYYMVINYANLAFLYFLKTNYKQVTKTIQKAYLNDFFPKIDNHLKVELALLELIARFELGDTNIFEYRLAQVKTSLKNEWKDYSGSGRIIFDIISRIASQPDYQNDQKIFALFHTYLESNTQNPNPVFNYDGWLKTRLGVTRMQTKK